MPTIPQPPPKPKKDPIVALMQKLAGEKESDAPPAPDGPSAELLEASKEIKEHKGLSFMLVAKFMTLIGMLEKLPNDVVSMCVNKKLLDRPDKENFKALPDDKRRAKPLPRPYPSRPNRQMHREIDETNIFERAKEDEN